MKKYYKYSSTMAKFDNFIDYLQYEECPQHCIDVFYMMYTGYQVGLLLNSAYFELLRISDGKYKMTVQKYVDETFSIKFQIDTDYESAIDRFA